MIAQIPYLESISRIRKKYHTGEEPVLVECDNLSTYICKYMRSSASGYKLCCELLGSLLAKQWNIYTPDIAYVEIKEYDWPHFSSINLSAPAFGSRVIEDTIDITRVSFGQIPVSHDLRKQLLKIALFDIWVANEDRNFNNSNLLYDLKTERLVAIDHGCIFNTASYDYPLTLLTSNESIIQSDLGGHLLKNMDEEELHSLIEELREDFSKWMDIDKSNYTAMIEVIPIKWNIPDKIIREKLSSLFTEDWSNDCWENFIEIIEDTEYV